MKIKKQTSNSKVTLGKCGEEKAAAYLLSKGYELLCRNFRCRMGEVDIIAKDVRKGGTIVFCEVKTRNNCAFGLPCESVTMHKLKKIKRMADIYAKINKWTANKDFRIDVIEILIMENKAYVRHLENVLS